ncbi:conserved Plasmodium protein, unknown function [Plasmodium chabaudi chabaudi]|uniref:Endonuclease/exonuclease/phosphatase domain-containing protein n=1 Tax=Plasmodium chabaudi chabaudi TaxID=31271 RepID=A0A1C6YBS7_PLACU|nr:conserved Plasmodium protein, unknown function [Plasmodium chabaudi chabaudi]
MIWMRLLKLFVATFMLEKIKNMFCLICNNNKAIKYVLNIRPNNIQEKAKYFYINNHNIVYNTSKKNAIKKKKLLFLLSKTFHCLANRRQTIPFHILKSNNNNTQKNSLFLFDHNFSKLKLCSPNYLGATRSFNSIFLNKMEGGEDKHKSSCNNEMKNEETNDTSEQNDRIQNCILKKKANFTTNFNDEKANKIQRIDPNCDEHEIKENIPNNDCNNDLKKNNIFTIEELEEMRKNSNYVKIDDTENTGFSIELYFDYKELKLLRKKDEPLSSLKNRLILNLNKLYQKQSKQLNSIKNKNANKTIDSNVKSEKEKENTTIVKFYDKENNIIDENTILKDVIDKLNYLVIDEHKISIYKNVYDLKKIYISMDVYANHQIIPVHLPLGEMENYIYYWVDTNEKNVLNSCDIFYKPTNDDISKHIQLVIYDKKNPIFFHFTEEMEVKSNPFEEQIRIKEQRYSDFLPQSNQHDNNAKNTLRILSYNILAPIYTNTKYALEYMFKNIDPCYLKTNYRSHLLIGEISHDFDIISLQEVSEHLHTNLFYVYLYENYYSSYKPKSPSGNDGCSLFVNKKKFSLLEYENCEFNTVVRSPELKNIYDIFIKLSDDLDEIIKEIKTVYQIGIFMHNNSQNIFIIANTHLYFHSLAQHIRVMQTYCILHILEKIKDKYKEKYKNKEIYVILNGDFNANFESEVFSFMEGSDVMENSKLWENGKLFKKEYDDLDKYPTLFNIDNNSTDQKINGPYLNRKKFLPLYSAYKKVDIPYTNWNNNFIDVLDYIFLSPELKVKRLLKGVDKHLFGQYKGIVTPFNPSDHLSIAAEIEL